MGETPVLGLRAGEVFNRLPGKGAVRCADSLRYLYGESLMNIEQLRKMLLYCTVMNFALLALWGLLYLLPHEWWYQAASRIFHVSTEQFDALSLAGIIHYKIGVLLFNLVPYLALRFMR